MKFRPSSEIYYPEYVFRVADGRTPFLPGSWSKSNELSNPGPKSLLYFSPVLYSWIHNWFNNESNRVFAILRPKKLSKDTMCCGVNSHYHYCFTKCPQLLPKLVEAIKTKNYRDTEIQKMFKEHEDRVMKRFGRKLRDMKGGEYMATLCEYDATHPLNAYPELILSIDTFSGCKWEELEYVRSNIFRGKASKKIFRIEQTLPKYGIRYRE